MDVKIPWEAVKKTEADMSATVNAGVVLSALHDTNAGDVQLILSGMAANLSLCIDRWANVGLLPSRVEKELWALQDKMVEIASQATINWEE